MQLQGMILEVINQFLDNRKFEQAAETKGPTYKKYDIQSLKVVIRDKKKLISRVRCEQSWHLSFRRSLRETRKYTICILLNILT